MNKISQVIPQDIKHIIKELTDKIPLLKRVRKKLYSPVFWLDNPRFSQQPLNYFQTQVGNYFLPVNVPINDPIACCMKNGLVFEPQIVDIANQYIENGSIVLDIGANFGQMSLLFSQAVGNNGQVFAFEADDYIYHILLKNLMANNCHNVRAFFGAVYDVSDKDMIYPLQDFDKFCSYGSFGISPNATIGRKIRSIAIDDLNIRDHISFVKIDVQGSDLFALRGAVETIKRHQMPILFEFEQRFQDEFHTSFQDYVDFVDSISYRFERTVNDINFLIVPDTRKVFAMPTVPEQLDSEYSQVANTSFLPPIPTGLCKILRHKSEISLSTDFLHRNGLIVNLAECKDWDLAHFLPLINDGNFLDMGSSDSYILKNLSLRRINGALYGIDLREPTFPLKDVKYSVGDLMDTKLPSEFFKNITCLSVIEHGVDFARFAKEASRLLENGGRLFVTFDYWHPKINSDVKLYGLDWQLLDEALTRNLISECERNHLYLVEDMDFSIGDAIIRDGYYSPVPEISYTFGMAVFEKKHS